MFKSTPLLNRQLREPIAWLINGLPELDLAPGPVDVTTFLSHVKSLADSLPEGAHVINLCANRYLFLVGLCAAIVNRQTSLLPPNKRPIAQQQLAGDYRSTFLIHDGQAELAPLPSFNLKEHRWTELNIEQTMPVVEDEFLAVVSFTSGSTGKAKANLKSFRTLAASTEINGRHMLPSSGSTFYHLATVPSQHMWGLETTVLMAMFENICLADSQPFYPADIWQHLEQLPKNRCLVATPLHLRSLLGSNSKAVALDNVLCATAPLTTALAEQVEGQFQTCLREVYGCSEVGSMAVRQPTKDELWQPFSSLDFVNDSGRTVVNANHLPVSISLEDQLNFTSEGLFTLQGRQSDQVKIAGKRGSLQEVNRVLLEFDGLQDAVAFMPEPRSGMQRLVALVVFKGPEDKKALRQYLRARLDSAFVPRPILVVESLPREENGKLSKQRVLDLYASLSSLSS